MSMWVIAICLMVLASPNALLFIAFMIAWFEDFIERKNKQEENT